MRKIKYREVRKLQPNYLEYTGIYNTEPVEMQLFVYNDEGFEEYKKATVERFKKEISDEKQANDVKWLNVHGLHDEEMIRHIGEALDLENFVIGDILNVARRPKMDELDDVLFFSIKSILQREESEPVRVEQISFLLKDNLLVSFQEKKSDFFTHIRERIRTHSGIVRKKKADYLMYLLLDAVMENFFVTIENYENGIEVLLVESKSAYKSTFLERIEKEREDLNFLKRSIVPLRDAMYNLKHGNETENKIVANANVVFFERLHQKSLELLEQIDYDMKSLDSASNLFFSSQSQRMNQIMKTLTIFSVIFMPLTFIVGVYGMNFKNMPELEMQNGYYMTLAVMFLIAVVMVIYFKRKHWF